MAQSKTDFNAPNKITSDLKTMILNALEKAGGEAYLSKQAQKNPSAFLTLLGKVLPMQLSGPDGGPMALEYKASPALLAAIDRVYSDAKLIENNTAYRTECTP